MCRSCGGTLAASRSYVEGAMRCAGAYGRPWRAHARPPLPRSMQALVRWLHCASCVLHRPGGVLHRQNPTASEASDARFRAIYSGMRRLPPVKSKPVYESSFINKSMGTTTEDSAQLTCMRRAKAYRTMTFCQTNERQHRHARMRGQMCSWHYVIPQRYLNCSM